MKILFVEKCRILALWEENLNSEEPKEKVKKLETILNSGINDSFIKDCPDWVKNVTGEGK